MLKFGFSWPNEMKAQHTISAILRKILDNKFILLRNITLPDFEETFPLILIGPPGVTVIYVSIKKGLYRAFGESWAIMDNRAKRYRSSKPNLQAVTTRLARSVDSYLSNHGINLPEVDSVLVFTHPGTTVDTDRPDVRILQVDAIERFGVGLAQRERILNGENVRAITDLFVRPPVPEDDGLLDESVFFVEEAPPESALERLVAPLQKMFPFSRRQWILLVFVAVAEAIILIIFLLLILSTA
jgi:hypothetical protein